MSVNTNRIISYSLYGAEERYTIPLLDNARSLASYYPGWTIYVYHDETVDPNYIAELRELNVAAIDMTRHLYNGLPPRLWRLLPTLQDDLECIIFRDADSVFTSRESALVSQWLESEKLVHIIRDHPLHVAPILAGMFGVKREAFSMLSCLLSQHKNYQSTRPHDYDQVLLADSFYPRVRRMAMIHTSFFRFCGEEVQRMSPVEDGHSFIGSVDRADESAKKHNEDLIRASQFIDGIPYWLAKLLRYRVRPVIYTSLIYQFFSKYARKS